jgi:hypothetical protein
MVHQRCFQLYEYSDFLGVLYNTTYTGSQQPEPSIGQFNSPLFDNPGLEGPPVAQLRGSYLVDVAAKYATYTSAAKFFDSDGGYFLAWSLGFSTASLSTGKGVVVGGTGVFRNYLGSVRSEPVQARRLQTIAATETIDSEEVVFMYTVCPSP